VYPFDVFSHRIQLFTIFGFTVRLDLSWLLMAALVASQFATGFMAPPDSFARGTSWVMGALIVAGLFVSIVLHELTHSLVARLHGMRMKGITLFLLGGVAEMQDEPPSPWAEFAMAIVGPLASLVVALAFGGAWWIAARALAPDPVTAVLVNLALMNVGLAIFNMLPAFPLDGGRVLRSILWHAKGDHFWATRIAGFFGIGFGVLLAASGVTFMAWNGSFQGITWVLVGLFVVSAARASVQQARLARAFEGLTVRRFMDPEVVSVQRWVPLSELAESYFGTQPESIFPVADGDVVIGVVTADMIARVPREDWPRRTVGEIAMAMPPEATASLDEDAIGALTRMVQAHLSRLFVMEQGRMKGVLRVDDLVRHLQSQDRLAT
jgi:Zn-dependent protease/predicted transcriptional regulator